MRFPVDENYLQYRVISRIRKPYRRLYRKLKSPDYSYGYVEYLNKQHLEAWGISTQSINWQNRPHLNDVNRGSW